MGKIKAKYTISWFGESSTCPLWEKHASGGKPDCLGQPETYCKQIFQPFQEQTEITRSRKDLRRTGSFNSSNCWHHTGLSRMAYHHRHSHCEQRRWSLRCRGASTVHQRMSSPKSTLCACEDGDGDARVKPGGRSSVPGMSETFPFSVVCLQNETPITATLCLSQHYLLEEDNLLWIYSSQDGEEFS